MVKSIRVFILFLTLFPSPIWAQDFSVPFNKEGLHDYHRVKILRDSSYVSIIPVNLRSKKTNQYDSFVALIIRQNKRGEVMYYSNVIYNDSSYTYSFLDLEVVQNKIFLCGYKDFGNTGDILGIVLKLNECFEVEKYILFKNINWTSHTLNSIKKINDNFLILQGYRMMQSDTIYTTALFIDSNLQIIHHASFLGDNGDVAITEKQIHLWGDAYYPRPSDPNVSDRKLNHVIFNFKGQIIYQNIENKGIENEYSAGSRIISSNDKSFLISCVGLKPPSIYFNGLRKMDVNGNVIKTVTLSETKEEEVATAICQVNNNRFIVVSIVGIDFDYRNCNLYLIDSNLNVIRKKRILPNYNYVDFLNCIGYNDGVLLYGQFLEKLDDNPKAILYKVDTFFNVTQLPNMSGYIDSLCLNSSSGQQMFFPSPDTVWVESLNLRKNLYNQTGLNDILIENLNIYPNPSSGNFKVSMKIPLSGKYSIYEVTGKIIKQGEFVDLDELNIKLDQPMAGVYYLKIYTEMGNFNKIILIDY